MILVTGAGGKTGKAVLKALVARGEAVRAFVRSAAHHAALKAIGVHNVELGEMDDPRAWSQAIRGTSAVYHICPNVSPHELPFAKALVAAAGTHGIRRFVYHSVLHPQIEAMPHHWAKLRVEEMLFSSGLDVTILQPTAYMQNSLAEWDRMVADGIYRVPYPVETKLSLVDLDDVADEPDRDCRDVWTRLAESRPRRGRSGRGLDPTRPRRRDGRHPARNAGKNVSGLCARRSQG